MVGKWLRIAALLAFIWLTFALHASSQTSVSDTAQHAIRDSGIESFLSGDYSHAKEQLLRAFTQDATDSRTILYLGLTFESLGDEQSARLSYARAQFSHPATTEELVLDARRHLLEREFVRQELRKTYENANALPDSTLNPLTIAVFPLVYTGTGSRYRPLGYGLSDALIQDLRKIPHIRVVDPLRVYTLLHTLSSTQLQYIDPMLATRLGKVLGAGYVVGGSIDVQNDAQLSIRFTRWDLVNVNFPQPVTHTELLDHLDTAAAHLLYDVFALMDVSSSSSQMQITDPVPTDDPDAFTEFSRGLEYEYSGAYSRAAEQFRLAASADPYFERAQFHRDNMDNLTRYGSNLENVVALLTGTPLVEHPPLLLLRLNQLGSNLGVNFGFGREIRAAVEGFTTAPLPIPPPPPAAR